MDDDRAPRERHLAAWVGLGAGIAVAGLAARELLRSRDGERLEDERALTTPMRHPQRARRAITINRPVGEVYRFWRDLERLPTFMTHLLAVEVTGDRTSHWVAEGPAGTTVEWDAELVEDVADQLLAWRSVPGADVPSTGIVRFAPAPAAQGTEVVVELDYEPPGGAVGRAVARLLGEEPAQQVADELRRCKQVIETGSVMVSHGQLQGPRTSRQLRPRVAQPVA